MLYVIEMLYVSRKISEILKRALMALFFHLSPKTLGTEYAIHSSGILVITKCTTLIRGNYEKRKTYCSGCASDFDKL